jgi:hypothetical protein
VTFAERLASDAFRFYAHEDVPSERDAEIRRWVDGLIGAAPDARDAAAGELDADAAVAVLAFAERVASLAVRSHAEEDLLAGLVAIALAWRTCDDPCDAIPPLGVLYQAARQAGFDPARLFARAGELAPPDSAPVFRDFLRRRDLDQIAAVMGYVEGQDPGGFRYYRVW